MNELTDRAALRELIDTFSILTDKRDIQAQLQLFTENAISETFISGKSFLKLKGRKEMEAAFRDFLKNFDTVYHFNGQQTLSINGDSAEGTVYCLITLIGTENGKRMKTSIGAIYQDEYIRENNHWLIAKRTGTFDWQDKQEIGQ